MIYLCHEKQRKEEKLFFFIIVLLFVQSTLKIVNFLGIINFQDPDFNKDKFYFIFKA